MSETFLGPAVRQLREGQRLSLRALAERSGFSASFLSQVENGQASPSISSMERIAAALGVSLGEFFQSARADSLITRAGGRPMLYSEWSRAQIEALGTRLNGQRLEPVLVTLEPGGSSGTKGYASTGEEFAMVQEGVVALTLGDAEQTLGAGDAVAILPGTLRRWRNPGEQPARILIVGTR
jgi:XRE family transcriptional regulator, regulator of sulfur utilization